MTTRKHPLAGARRLAAALMLALIVALGTTAPLPRALADEALDEAAMLAEDEEALAQDSPTTDGQQAEDEVALGDEVPASDASEEQGIGADEGETPAVDEDAQADVRLQAQDVSATYTVSFDSNGGAGGMDPMLDCVEGQPYELPTSEFSRAGYTFAEWNTAADGSGTRYANAGQIQVEDATATPTVTLYAQWKLATYRISYTLNGGTNSAANPSQYTMDTPTITLAPPTRTGYTFVAWYADAQFQTKVVRIATGSSGNKTLFAKWAPISYTVVFRGNGATGSTTSLTGCKYDVATTLPANGFVRKGYAFASWNTKPDGTGTRYANKASVRNLSKTNGDTVALYAQWSPVTYTVTYKLGGGTNSAKNPKKYTVTTATVKLANPTRKGFKFGGWFADAKYAKQVSEIAKGSTGNKTLYAKWTKVTYKIAYKLGGGKNSAKNPKKYTVTTATIKLANPTRKGYKFGGWFADAKYTKRVKTIAKDSTGNKTLHAKWTAVKYKITYKLNGGRNSSKNPANYTIASKKITLANPVRTGYRFGGWFADAKYTKRVKTIAKGSTGNKTLYAKWTVNKYKIVFKGNGATSGSMASQTGLAYGKSYRLRGNAFRRTNKVFAGWNTRADGKGTAYANGVSVKNLTSKHGDTVTLYAQWDDLVAIKALGYYDYGGVVTVTNHYSTSVSIDVTFLYYDGGTLAKTSHQYMYCLEPGQTCALNGWSMDARSYTSWSYSLSWEPASSSTVGNANNISYSSNWGDDNVVVSVRNSGRTTDFTQIAVVFYKDGRVVGYSYRYADVDNPGSVDYLEFSYPYTRDYDTIYPDSYKVFVNESYTYDWAN